ncbi:MAG: Hsp70 family protein [Calditrichia bacterium]
MVLLEEPLSAFYAWLSKNENNWQEEMEEGQLILVCDVGGGTTDFSIIGIKAGEKGLRFNRLAVGEHLMLGGDNMDLALGRYLEKRLMGQPGKLDSRRWHQLVHQCRKAKEMLLGTPEAQAKMDITVMGTAGKLIADTLKTSLSQEEIRTLILEGFFPQCGLDEPPVEGRRRGRTELGLPFVQDPAITHHLAAFWKRFENLLREETGRETLYPDFVLFNGGALSPQIIRQHLKKIIGNWFENEAGLGWQPDELENLRPDLSVAIGAAYYGLVRLGKGVRVGSGSPRAYYIEVGTDEEMETKTAVCIVPRGTEEGFEVQMDQPAFELLTNQPVVFQLFSSSTRLGDTLGEIVQLAPDEITTLPQIRTVLRYGKKGEARKLPVQIVVRLTEIGTLELWCQSRETPHRWQLQFDVRQDTDVQEELQLTGETIEVELIEKAENLIRATFQGGEECQIRHPERLTKKLQEFLEMKKEKWPTPLIRKMADTLLECAEGRGLSAHHEARWLNLLGYCTRPGYGAPVDDWRMKQIWRLYLQGMKFPKQDQVRSEWWIFWRRVAGGLTTGRQQQIYQQVLPLLQNVSSRKGKSKKSAKRLNAQEELEIRMMTSNFERLSPEAKIELGRLLLQKIRNSKPKNQELWTIGRLGARIPIYGPLDRLIPSEEVMGWIHALLSLPIEINDAYAHTLVQLSRLTGDRTRDIPEELRNAVAERLKQLQKSDYFIELLLNPESASRKEEQDWAFGESLPAGLVVELNLP